jgi:hypothetical protein
MQPDSVYQDKIDHRVKTIYSKKETHRQCGHVMSTTLSRGGKINYFDAAFNLSQRVSPFSSDISKCLTNS